MYLTFDTSIDEVCNMAILNWAEDTDTILYLNCKLSNQKGGFLPRDQSSHPPLPGIRARTTR